MLLIILFFINIILVIYSFFKEQKRKSIFRFFLLFVLFLLFIFDKYGQYNDKYIIIKNDIEYKIPFDNITKKELIQDKYGNFYPIFIIDNPQKNKNVIIINKDSLDIKYDFYDMGIDTFYTIQDSIIVKIKNFSGEFIPCTLKFLSQFDSIIIFPADSIVTVKKSDFENIDLISNDKNDYNEHIKLNNKPIVLLLNKSYSKKLQNLSNIYSALFPEYQFFSGIIKDNKIITITRNFNAILTDIDSSFIDTNILILKSLDIDNDYIYKNVYQFLYSIRDKQKIIKSPFTSKNIFNENTFLIFIRQHIFEFILIILIVFFLIQIF